MQESKAKAVRPKRCLPKSQHKNIEAPPSQGAELKAALLIALQIPSLKEPGRGTRYGSKDAKAPTRKRELWTADKTVGFLMAL